VADLKETSNIVRDVKETSEEGLPFKPGRDWNNLCVGAIADASHASEVECMSDGTLEPYRSQGAKLIVLTDRGALTSNSSMLHFISLSSTIVRRMCRATTQVETYNLQQCAEAGDVLRAAIADFAGALDHSSWEASAAAYMPTKW